MRASIYYSLLFPRICHVFGHTSRSQWSGPSGSSINHKSEMPFRLVSNTLLSPFTIFMPPKNQAPTANLESSTESLLALSSYLSASSCTPLKFAPGGEYHGPHGEYEFLKHWINDLMHLLHQVKYFTSGMRRVLWQGVEPRCASKGISEMQCRRCSSLSKAP